MMARSPQQTILVLRFSALGDVALTVPVIKALLAANKDVSVVMASEKSCAGLFSGIDRLTFEGFDLKAEFRDLLASSEFLISSESNINSPWSPTFMGSFAPMY